MKSSAPAKTAKRGSSRAGLTTLAALLTLACVVPAPLLADENLVPAGSTWKYLDDGSNAGSNWRETVFDDHLWSAGAAPLGYGDGDEATVVSYGGNSKDKFITTYFRTAFTVSNPSIYSELVLELVRDDGAVVHLNGREVFRSNMPSGTINYWTPASGAVGGASESTFYSTTVAASNLVSGMNVVAVEIHQSGTNSSDISFDLRLGGVREPMAITLLSPANGTLDVESSPSLTVSVSDPENDSMAVSFYGRVAGPAPGPDFTLVALPDTQCYVANLGGGIPSTFVAQTDWIVANRTARNIVFVTQLGDCVQNGDKGGDDSEWRHATNALYRMEDPALTFLTEGIAYGVAVGNHDQSPVEDPDGTTTFYNQYFGESHFAGRNYYGGHYGTNNDNHYELFSASGLDFVIVHLEYDTSANPAVLTWADAVLKVYSDRRAIIVSHYIINAGFDATFGTQGRAIYEALKENPNLFLMLCGHVSPEEGQRVDTYNGHTVYTLMSDYQSRANGGNGWMRLLEFSPSNNVIRVKTYSPTLDQFETDADSQFTVPYDMEDWNTPFTVLGTNGSIASEANTALAVQGLSAGTDYEWCAMASDGTNCVTSGISRFRTLEAPAEAAGSFTIACQFDSLSHQIFVSWPSTTGTVYQVVYKDHVGDADWTDLSGEITAAGSTTVWSETVMPGNPARFYGVRIVR